MRHRYSLIEFICIRRSNEQRQSGGEGVTFLGQAVALVVAAPDGIWVGLMTGAGISVAYGIIYFLFPQLLSQRWLLALIFAVVGAVVAALSLRPLLAEYQVAAILCGALFGLVASLPLSKHQASVAQV